MRFDVLTEVLMWQCVCWLSGTTVLGETYSVYPEDGSSRSFRNVSRYPQNTFRPFFHCCTLHLDPIKVLFTN